MAIGSAQQKGTYVYVYDENNRSIDGYLESHEGYRLFEL